MICKCYDLALFLYLFV